MKRADYQLDADHLSVPSAAHMFNGNSMNVVLDKIFGQDPGAIKSRRVGMFTNFVRLLDKALREYDAASAELQAYVDAPNNHVSSYLRAMDHFENCIDAVFRATQNVAWLQNNGVGRKGPKLTARQLGQLKDVRNAIEHSDEKTAGLQARYATSPIFQEGEPASLALANRGMAIGGHRLSYRELLTVLTKMYATLEVMRGPSVSPPGAMPGNAALRTIVPMPTVQPTMHATAYVKELARMTVNYW